MNNELSMKDEGGWEMNVGEIGKIGGPGENKKYHDSSHSIYNSVIKILNSGSMIPTLYSI